jgi:hypothetical protein
VKKKRNEFILYVEQVKNITTEVWVYKKLDNKLILINENKPTFFSKLKVSKELGISYKKLSKIIDTKQCYKNLFFFSEEYKSIN